MRPSRLNSYLLLVVFAAPCLVTFYSWPWFFNPDFFLLLLLSVSLRFIFIDYEIFCVFSLGLLANICFDSYLGLVSLVYITTYSIIATSRHNFYLLSFWQQALYFSFLIFISETLLLFACLGYEFYNNIYFVAARIIVTIVCWMLWMCIKGANFVIEKRLVL